MVRGGRRGVIVQLVVEDADADACDWWWRFWKQRRKHATAVAWAVVQTFRVKAMLNTRGAHSSRRLTGTSGQKKLGILKRERNEEREGCASGHQR